VPARRHAWIRVTAALRAVIRRPSIRSPRIHWPRPHRRITNLRLLSTAAALRPRLVLLPALRLLPCSIWILRPSLRLRCRPILPLRSLPVLPLLLLSAAAPLRPRLILRPALRLLSRPVLILILRPRLRYRPILPLRSLSVLPLRSLLPILPLRSLPILRPALRLRRPLGLPLPIRPLLPARRRHTQPRHRRGQSRSAHRSSCVYPDHKSLLRPRRKV
jgi:hypothetical protein